MGPWPGGEGAWVFSSRRGLSLRPAPASKEGRGKNALSLKKIRSPLEILQIQVCRSQEKKFIYYS
jgi:hypothetical protein